MISKWPYGHKFSIWGDLKESGVTGSENECDSLCKFTSHKVSLPHLPLCLVSDVQSNVFLSIVFLIQISVGCECQIREAVEHFWKVFFFFFPICVAEVRTKQTQQLFPMGIKIRLEWLSPGCQRKLKLSQHPSVLGHWVT